MKLFITGANGQVGTALIHEAKQSQFAYLALRKDELDIRHEASVLQALENYQPNVCINAAAYTNVDQAESFKELATDINQHAVGILARACDRLNIPLLHISTDYVFDGKKQTPYLETDVTQPLNNYGASKLEGENELLKFAKRNIILRTSWVFSHTGNNFVKTMLRLFQQKEEISVVNDQMGGPTSAQAIAKALLIIAERVTEKPFDDWGIYHFAGAPMTSWYAFACKIQELLHKMPVRLKKIRPIPSHEFPSNVIRPQHTVLDMEKINRIFGISPCDWQKDLHDCLNILMAETKKNEA